MRDGAPDCVEAARDAECGRVNVEDTHPWGFVFDQDLVCVSIEVSGRSVRAGGFRFEMHQFGIECRSHVARGTTRGAKLVDS